MLWLDPATPASHYQMPFKLTDALAMGTPVFANRISDLDDLIAAGYVTHVPFGDGEALSSAIASATPDRPRSRALFLRQFSYAACRANFAILAARAQGFPAHLDAAKDFAATFEEYYLDQSSR